MEENKPLVSCIVPVYNVEKYLDRCISSLLAQTYSDYEIVIINDGSTDQSAELLKKYSNQNKIRIFSQKNQGLSAARNQGIKLAKGDYVTFIDSDDWVDKEYLNIMVEQMLKYDADIVSVDYLVCNHEKNVEHKNEKVKIFYDEKCADALFAIEIDNYAWGKLIKRNKLFEKIFPVGKRYEDIASMYKVYDSSNVVVLVKGIYYFYFQNESSITNDRKIKDVNDKLDFIEEMNNYSSKKNYEYWGFYRIIKAFGALSDLFKIKGINKYERKKYIKKIYAEIRFCKIPLKYFNFDGNWMRAFLMKTRIAHIMLYLKHL